MKSQKDNLNEFKNLSHDIQNILSTIVNNVQLLKRNIESDAPALKYANIIESNSQRASEIIHEFLSGKKHQKRIISSDILFQDITLSFSNNIPDDIEFTIINDNSNSAILGNYTDLFRAFLNLLINAKEAIAGKGKIVFERKTLSGKKVSFTVKDTGCGIPESAIDDIFKSDFSTKNKDRESGMGLNIVNNLINDHNGTIEVKSKINKGTEFRVNLPIFVEKNLEGFNKKVLIADDDNSLRESLADLFDSFNYLTFQAKDGDEVLEILNNNHEIDILVIDKKMPKKDGIKCISEIRANNKSLPIVLVTGINLELSELEELENANGANKIVLKPYDFVYLKEIVDSLVL